MAEEPSHIPPRHPRKSFHPGWLAAASVSAVAVGILSLLPSEQLPPIPPFPGADKLAHAAFYLILGFLGTSSLVARSSKAILTVVILLAVYGLLLEIGQRFVPGRSYEFLDAVANAGGAGLGAAIPYFRNHRGSRSPENPG